MSRIAAMRGRLFGPSSVLLGTTAIVNVLRIGNTIVLSRLLAPRDFGLASIVLSVFFIIGMLTDTGHQAFVIRHERSEEPNFLDAVWTAHLGRGVLLALLVAALAWPVGLIMAKPEVAPLLAVGGLFYVIDALASTSLLTVLRDGRVQKLSIIDLAAFLTQMVFGIAAALLFRDVWAIVASLLIGAVARSIMSYTMFPGSARRLRIDAAVVRELWGFSRVIGASSWLTLLIAQVDKLVLGRLFTLPQFGTYAIASNLATAPTQIVYMYTSRIIYPAIANQRRTAPERMKEAIYSGRGFVFYGYLFAVGGLIGGAGLLIRLIYDPRYLGAAPFLQLLAISSGLMMLTSVTSESLIAIGQNMATLRMNAARVAWLAVAGVAGIAFEGPVGLVFALGTIELPAYLYGAVAMRRLGYFDAGRDFFAFAMLAIGIAAGMIVNFGARALLGL